MPISEPVSTKNFVFPSTFDVLDGLVDETMQFYAQAINDEDLVYNIVLVATELVTNAIEHGNALVESKKVFVTLAYNNEVAAISVRDEGQGFNPATIDNPLSSDSLLAEGGRGIFLIEQIADRVEYENNGQTVVSYFDYTKDK